MRQGGGGQADGGGGRAGAAEKVDAAVPGDLAVDYGALYFTGGAVKEVDAHVLYEGVPVSGLCYDYRDAYSTEQRGGEEVYYAGMSGPAQASSGDYDASASLGKVAVEWGREGVGIVDGVGGGLGEEAPVGYGDGVAYGFVARQAFAIHGFAEWHAEVDVVVDAGFGFAGMGAVQSPGVLCYEAFPGYGHGQHECVEAWQIETFSDIFSCGYYHQLLMRVYPGQPGHYIPFCLGGIVAYEADYVAAYLAALVSK